MNSGIVMCCLCLVCSVLQFPHWSYNLGLSCTPSVLHSYKSELTTINAVSINGAVKILKYRRELYHAEADLVLLKVARAIYTYIELG